MVNCSLRSFVVERLLPQVQTPGQYLGGEWNSVVKDHCRLRGRLCLAFPDAYTIGMSCHAIHVLYEVMNALEDWCCERAFMPLPDMEQKLRQHALPLFSLETFTPLKDFDVLGFTLQHELCYANVLTMLDLGGIPLHAQERTLSHPLVIAGGPGVSNPEPMAPFFDLFVIGDGEQALPEVCNLWLEEKQSHDDRFAALAALAQRLPYVYVPGLYQPVDSGDNWPRAVRPLHDGLPERIRPAIVADLNSVSPPRSPVVPFVACVQDRMVVEIMRGCPGKCRFCQSTTIKRPLRHRSVENIISAAEDQYRHTGQNELALLSLSSSDYPWFDDLLKRLQETFRPLHVSISLPSLRVNEQLRGVSELLNTDRHSGLTLAPEAARDDMRRVLGKPISNEDLFQGCRCAMERGFSRVKLYFLCGLPGEREADLRGIIEMAETISHLGKEIRGRPAQVVANVSNFIPKPQTPFQWLPMQRREYFQWAHNFLRRQKTLRSVQLRCHDIEASLCEGLLCRGDRRLAAAIQQAWRSGARLDGWAEHFRPQLWWQAVCEAGIDSEKILHQPLTPQDALPWDHIDIYQGRKHLEHEWRLGQEQLGKLAQN